MRVLPRLLLGFVLALGGCSKDEEKDEEKKKPGRGRVVIAVTVDWEGVFISPEGLEAMGELRSALPRMPLTHFISAAYFTKKSPIAEAGPKIKEAIKKGDEAAVHLHAWHSLSREAGVAVKEGRSFLSGSEQLMRTSGDDLGYDLDLEVFTVEELRALIKTSAKVLERETDVELSKSFRAGGYLGIPAVLEAVRAEGLTVDSSSADPRHVTGDGEMEAFFSKRVQELWPDLEPTSQPFFIETPEGTVLEMPVSGVADHLSAQEAVGLVRLALAKLKESPDRHVFLTLGLHHETAAEFAGVLQNALTALREDEDISPYLEFSTIEGAAERAREQR